MRLIFQFPTADETPARRPLSAPVTVVGQPVLFDHVGRLFRDHDGRRVRVAADDRGHDGRVDHAQPLHAVHPESGVHHRGGVAGRSHLARADRMVDGHAEVADGAFPVLVRAELVPRAAGYGHPVQPRPVLPESFALADLRTKTVCDQYRLI